MTEAQDDSGTEDMTVALGAKDMTVVLQPLCGHRGGYLGSEGEERRPCLHKAIPPIAMHVHPLVHTRGVTFRLSPYIFLYSTLGKSDY